MLQDLQPGVMLHRESLLGPRDIPSAKGNFQGGMKTCQAALGLARCFSLSQKSMGIHIPGWDAHAWSCCPDPPEGDYALLGSAKFMAVNVSTRGRCL